MYFGELIGAYIIDANNLKSLEYSYYDEYLRPNILPHTELRAKLEINYLGLKNEFFKNKLVVLKTYIICCLENQTTADDLFATKLKQYKTEFESIYNLALQDKKQSELSDSAFALNDFNCPIMRG